MGSDRIKSLFVLILCEEFQKDLGVGVAVSYIFLKDKKICLASRSKNTEKGVSETAVALSTLACAVPPTNTNFGLTVLLTHN